MEYPSLDPYEQQLRKVFDSHDYESRGSLDRDGLNQLCCTLQLEEQGNELVQRLLKSSNSVRVSFVEFKDALLKMLDNVQNGRMQTEDEKSEGEQETGSPDREVSPKYVYGSKKYGRRSRPKNEDEDGITEELNENVNYTNKIAYNSVQRSNSQNDVMCLKKRKTNIKLKRCTSFPGNHEVKMSSDTFVTRTFNNQEEFICTEDMLRKAWKKLGVGEDGYLNQNELILVCDAIGLHRLAKGVIRQLSNKLELDLDRKISFKELLEALQQDDTWLEVLNPSPTIDDAITSNCNFTKSIFPDLKITSHITLGPDGTGYVNIDIISEMWENVGISSPKLLLQELGFINSQISVAELALSLEKEIKCMNEAKSNFANPLIVLLHAILELYKSEIRCLKNLVEQMHAEREKLKSDVFDANNRAVMLAQEVDDNHTRMEESTLHQVKQLEQKHAEMVKEVSRQFVTEKEQVLSLNQNLERKISCLESEEAKLINDLRVAQEYLISAEKENQILNNQITELQQSKNTLAEQVAVLENEKQNYEYENQHAQIEPLLEKLSTLQIENSQLRDKNDEMLTEIESLNNQICVMRNKCSSTPTFYNLERSMEENVSVICDGVGQGSKRRSDESPSKDLNTLGMGDSSPRLGKVRRCHKTKSDNFELPITSSESGFDTEVDAIDSSLSISINDNEEVNRLQTKIAHLEDLLKKHNIPVPSQNFDCTSDSASVSDDMKIQKLSKHCIDLQNVLLAVQTDLNKFLSMDDHICSCESLNLVKNLNEKLSDVVSENVKKNCCDASTETDFVDLNLDEQIEKYIKENETLVNKCAELENCIELLRTEYEKCEDYWSSKLDEERQMFELEQSQSGEKLTELISKIAEYDAQFVSQSEIDSRLPTIDESFNLEKQFNDLEQEFEDYKEQMEFQIEEKSNEVVDLKEKLETIQQKSTTEFGTQTCNSFEFNSLENKLSNLSNCVVESTNLFSSDTMPFNWKNNQSEKSQDVMDHSDAVWNKSIQTHLSTSSPSSLEPNCSYFNKTSQSYSSVESASIDNIMTPTRPKRTRKHEKNYKVQRMPKTTDNPSNGQNSNSSFKWNASGEGCRTNNGEQKISLPVTVLHNLNGRLHHLEQRCRHLQVVLKQQHYHAEQMLQHCWQQHRGEKAELQYLLKNNQEKLEYQMRLCNEQLERLGRTDILVKDLYVENSYLVANVQRLEKQCHILTQYNSASSSV